MFTYEENCMKFLKSLLTTALVATTLLPAIGHSELYSPKTGLIRQIDVSVSDNRNFRVFLKDVPFECGSGETYAYIDNTANNFDTFLSVILAAKMANKPIRLYNQAGIQNNCVITYLILPEEG